MKLNSSFRLGRSSSRRGFTLIEMVLVLAVIALIVGAGVTHLRGVDDVARGRTTLMKMTGLQSALELYALSAGRYPTQEQGIQALLERPVKEPLPKSWAQQVKNASSLTDAWGNPIQYRVPGANGFAYDLFSLGVDGVESSDDIRLE